MLDKIADRGKAAGSCPLGFGREWCDRAAVISQGSGQGVEGEHPSEQAFAQNSLALLGLAQNYLAHDPPALARDHGQQDERPRLQTGHQVKRRVAAGPKQDD